MSARPGYVRSIWSARPAALRMVKGGAHHAESSTAEQRIAHRTAPGTIRRGDRSA